MTPTNDDMAANLKQGFRPCILLISLTGELWLFNGPLAQKMKTEVAGLVPALPPHCLSVQGRVLFAIIFFNVYLELYFGYGYWTSHIRKAVSPSVPALGRPRHLHNIHIKKILNQVQWEHSPLISALKWQRQVDLCKFESSLVPIPVPGQPGILWETLSKEKF